MAAIVMFSKAVAIEEKRYGVRRDRVLPLLDLASAGSRSAGALLHSGESGHKGSVTAPANSVPSACSQAVRGQ